MEEICSTLNEKQREAVLCTEGPELVLAGAGSGKTRVITHRIAYLIREKQVSPRNILAITFTNKAAGEMKRRVGQLVSEESDQIWVATFHATCVRILRRFIDRLGYDSHFTIYDTDDQRALMKQVLKELNLDPKTFRERSILAAVSSAKNELRTPAQFSREASGYYEERTADCYHRYQEKLAGNDALDFDDLLTMTVELFRTCPDVLELYRRRFRYIMVDEYQDTNTAQFALIELLAGKDGNLCVVGDDDQSIYRFRGANIYNILNFEKTFPGAHVVKLEENYRSKGNILSAANEVIRNNLGRKEKHLWTRRDAGEKIHVFRFENASDEAEHIAEEIRQRASDGRYSRFAVLYRTNAQSRALEERFVTLGIPYQLIGGVNFYQRKEVKDALAYLKTIANGRDDLACRRILNVPKRGIGDATAQKVMEFAAANGLSFYDALLDAEKTGILGRSGGKIRKFTDLIESLRERSRSLPLTELIREMLDKSGYLEDLANDDPVEAEARRQNLEELLNKAAAFENDTGAAEEPEDESASPDLPALDRFLEEVSLVADIDRMDTGAEKVTLMTLHAAKGLEFDEVYMTGMEDGLFPGMRSLDDPKELEEERRLCYVGITRARERLTMTGAARRMVNGETRFSNESMFVREIPDSLKERKDYTERPQRTSWHFDGPGEAESFRRAAPKPAAFGKEFRIVKADHLEYGPGDRVKHMKFGEGTVLRVEEGARDFEVTVDFGSHGVRKMFAGFAKLEKIG